MAQVYVVCTDELEDWACQLTDLGIAITALQRQPGFQYSLVREDRAVVANYDRPFVHCHHYTPFIYDDLAALPIAGCASCTPSMVATTMDRRS